MTTVSVVIPTMNEEIGIEATLKQIPFDAIHRMGLMAEVIIVDGCSRDKTVERARAMGAKVIVEPRRGYGRAYKTGLRSATGSFIVILDGDATYPPRAMVEMLEALTRGRANFVNTSRLQDHEEGAFSPSHLVGNRILSQVASVLFGIGISDIESGMMGFTSTLKAVFTSIKTDSVGYSPELKIRGCMMGKYLEIPISYRPRLDGESQYTSIMRTVRGGLGEVASIIWLRFALRGRRWIGGPWQALPDFHESMKSATPKL